MFRRPAHVIAYEEIQQAVAVVVKPQRGSAEAKMMAEAALRGDIDKRALAGVAEEAALADARDENIGEAVVIVIADGDAHPIQLHVEAGRLRDISESAVAIVAIEAQSAALALVAGPVHAVDEQNVLPAVGVVIKKGATGAECLRKKFPAECPAIVAKIDAGARGDINQAESEREVRHCREEARRREQREGRGAREKIAAIQERPAHGKLTRPLRMA
ncbi:MAG TPA: hypothetical protein VFA13_11985 [Candidatus Acidoferrum sp.]|nr:hypothetical protein [Candidatus Acidoferrum sp.]